LIRNDDPFQTGSLVEKMLTQNVFLQERFASGRWTTVVELKNFETRREVSSESKRLKRIRIGREDFQILEVTAVGSERTIMSGPHPLARRCLRVS